MTDDTRFDDIYSRLNELTHDVANLKIQAGAFGTTNVAVSQNLTLSIGLASDMREVKADIREIKADIRNINASIDEILRLVRRRNDEDISS